MGWIEWAIIGINVASLLMMIFKSKKVLPGHLDEAGEWIGTDDDIWYMRWRMHVKKWFAFGNKGSQGVTGTVVLFPLLYVLPVTVWFTGWSWWYLLPVAFIPVLSRWRKNGFVIFAARGLGAWRVEEDGKKDIVLLDRYIVCRTPDHGYLSRVQYWCRWHIQVQWPFMVSGHWYFRGKDVPTVWEREDTDGELVFIYRGYHRDADSLYWGDGGFAGGVWK